MLSGENQVLVVAGCTTYRGDSRQVCLGCEWSFFFFRNVKWRYMQIFSFNIQHFISTDIYLIRHSIALGSWHIKYNLFLLLLFFSSFFINHSNASSIASTSSVAFNWVGEIYFWFTIHLFYWVCNWSKL